ncbi:MAG: SxtJ family membrane protein [Verrucomicrobiota bacterium]|jgi:hypothetical protein
MKLNLSEDPKEWRKAAWMSALGLAVLGTLLRWRRVLPVAAWIIALCALAAVAAAAARPRWFRGWYRFSARLGFGFSRLLGRILLALFFFVIMAPPGVIMRRMGKDPLRLKRPSGNSHWSAARPASPLDRLF